MKVDAVLSGLANGKDYGFAEIVSPDPPTESALCGRSVRGVEAPFNDPFRCFIEPEKNGRWRVAEIIIEGLPEDVEGITGQLVHERDGKVRTVYAVPGPDLPPVPFRLFDKALWDANLASIDADTEVCFDARRDRSGYVITTIHSPTPREAFGTGEDAPVVIAKVQKDWEAGTDANGVYVAVRGDDTSVAAAAFTTSRMLRGAGLYHVVPWNEENSDQSEPIEKLFTRWEHILEIGKEAERDNLEIDRLKVALEWVEAQAKWRVAALLRPRALRMPKSGEEFVDWVEGVVKGAPKEVRPSGREEGDDGGGDASVGVRRRKFSVRVRFHDKRVGRGTADHEMREDWLVAADLADGVPVIVRLCWGKDGWRIDRVHRSEPNIPPRDR